jgi:hypothetical protein
MIVVDSDFDILVRASLTAKMEAQGEHERSLQFQNDTENKHGTQLNTYTSR